MEARCQAYTKDGTFCGRRAVVLDSELEYFVCERHRSDPEQQTNDVYGIVMAGVPLAAFAAILLSFSVALIAEPSHLVRDLIISVVFLILGGAALALWRWRYQQMFAASKEFWGFRWSREVDKLHEAVMVLCGALCVVFGALLSLRAMLL